MFEQLPPLRRKDRQISLQECEEILEKAEYMVMATVDKEQIPYAAPLSFVYLEGKIYFHTSIGNGHKRDNLAENPYCSLAIVGDTQPVYANYFTTYFESVIVFGKVTEIFEPQRKKAVLFALAEKYLPEHMENAEKDISGSLARTAVFEISVDRITGKAKRPKTEL